MSIDELHSELNKIDINQKDWLEKKEIEDFLSKEEDVKKLWDIMQNHFETESETLQQFKESVWKICEKILKNNNISINQWKILVFYLKHFFNETDKVSKKILKNIDNWTTRYQEVLTDINMQNLAQRMEEIRKQEEQRRANELFRPMREEQERQEAEREKCFKLIDSEGRLTSEEIQWLREYKDRAWIYLVQKDKDRIEERLKLEEIDMDITDETLQEIANNPLWNLDSIDAGLKESKPNWGNLTKDLKTYEDVQKISVDNISNYLTLPEWISEENKYYVVKNFQNIMWRHLCLHPWYKIWWWKDPNLFATGFQSLKQIVEENNLLEHAYQKFETIKNDGSGITKKMEKIFNTGNHILFELFVKDQISKCKTDEERWKKIYTLFSTAEKNDKFKIFISQNSYIKHIWSIYDEIKKKELEAKREQDLINRAKLIKIPQNLNAFWDESIHETRLFNKIQLQQFEKYYNTWLANFDKIFEASKDFWCWKNIPNQLWLPECLDVEEYFKYNSRLVEMNKRVSSIKQRYRNETHVIRPEWTPWPNWKSLENKRDEAILKEIIEMAKIYVSYWNKSTGSFRPQKFCGIDLKRISWSWDKFKDPDDIVRDTTGEKLLDNIQSLIRNAKNDYSKCAWDLLWIIWWTIAACGVSLSWWWVLASWAAYELWSRVCNGLVQETINFWEIALQSLGAFEDNWNNRVDNIWESFLLWAGLMERNENGIPVRRSWESIGIDILFSTGSTIASFWLLKAWTWSLNLFAKSYIFGWIDNFIAQPWSNILKAWAQAGLWIWEYGEFSVLEAMQRQWALEITPEWLTQKLFNTVATWAIIWWLWKIALNVGKKYFKGVNFNFVKELESWTNEIRSCLKRKWLYKNSWELVESIMDDELTALYSKYATTLNQWWTAMKTVLASPLVTYNLLHDEASPQTILSHRIAALWNKLKNTTDESKRNQYNQLLSRYQELQKRLQNNESLSDPSISYLEGVDPDEVARQIIAQKDEDDPTNNIEDPTGWDDIIRDDPIWNIIW